MFLFTNLSLGRPHQKGCHCISKFSIWNLEKHHGMTWSCKWKEKFLGKRKLLGSMANEFPVVLYMISMGRAFESVLTDATFSLLTQ